GGDQHGGDGKSQPTDRGHPERRENDAADTPTVVSHCERGPLSAHEPGRHDRVDRYGAHCAPTRSAEQRGREQLPACIRDSPAKRAERERESRCLRPRRSTKASVKSRQIGSHSGADKKMHGNRSGYQGHWPSRCLVDNAQIDGRPIEPHSPTEESENEGSADHPPSIE